MAALCLWSTESQRLLTRFSQKHAGMVLQTDVCFSPYNKLLMVRHTDFAPAALCSVTVLRDGMTLIGGGTDEAQKQDQEPSELSSEGLVVHTPFIPPSYPNRLAAKADPQSSYMPKLVLQTPLVRDSKMGPFVTPALNAATPGLFIVANSTVTVLYLVSLLFAPPKTASRIFSPLENEAGLLQTNKSTVTMAPAWETLLPVPNPDVSSIFSPLVTVSTEARSGPPCICHTVNTARPLVPVTTSMNQVSSAPSQDFPPSTALTETSLMASSVQSSIAAVQTTVSNATVVSFASQRADSVAESEESDHMILTEQNPLASLTRSAPAFQHAEAPAIQVQYLEGLIKDTAEELRNTLSVNMDLPMLCCIGSERTHGIVITERIA
eukprot:Em0651g2a